MSFYYLYSAECALEEYKYSQTGNTGMTYNCDSNGNYADLQWVGSMCFCVNADGNKIEGKMAHISSVRELEC